jgi:hypothetical protein
MEENWKNFQLLTLSTWLDQKKLARQGQRDKDLKKVVQ